MSAAEFQGGILTGPAIREAVENGDIVIQNYDPKRVNDEFIAADGTYNPASYDLKLGPLVKVYRDVVAVEQPSFIRPWSDEERVGYMKEHGYPMDHFLVAKSNGVLDSKKELPTWEFSMHEERGWLVKPGIGYLMHTAERVRTQKYVPIVDGKSSTGRLFVTAHVTAGYGDPGFDGQYTLEVVSTHRVILYPGMFFCQIRFHTKVGPHQSYAGNYTGEASLGPVASRSWRQFTKEPP